MDRYEPIDCGVHDQFLEWATLRQPVAITYESNNGDTSVANDVIKDVYTKDGAEYLRLADGLEIRLDKITDTTPLR